MADAAELRMNVEALKRVDPYVKDILGSSSHVALYTFSPANSEWEKTEIEGALFVYSRNGEPYNSILIMNRLNTKNLVEPIVKDLDWQMQPPFLLYRNSKNNIYGIWFYNRDECIKITYLLENLMEGLTKSTKLPDKASKKPNAGVDIFSMLSKAQEDFNKTPSKSEPLVQLLSSTPQAPDSSMTSQSVMDFFAKASTTKQTKTAPAQSEGDHLQPILHRLMSNPAHSVEHIEKQQRSVTPQDHSVLLRKAGAKPFQNDTHNQSLENGIKFMRIASPTLGTSPLAPFYSQSAKNAAGDDSELTGISPPLASILDSSIVESSKSQKPALMPPMMFTSTSLQEKDQQQEVKAVEPLTKNQMLQALSYLLRTDPDFVTKLHEAYVKSFTEILHCKNSSVLNL